nr:hypothetical protein [Tanacetum cinerariifolium]
PEAEDADDELEVEEAGVEPEAKGADVELEAKEPDGVPEAVIRAGSQRPFAIRDFSYRAERRLSESIRWNKGFCLEMVRKGAVLKLPSDDEGSERPRKSSRKSDGD